MRLGKNVSINEAGCWIWEAARDGNGYGHFYVGGKNRLAHRVAFALFNGGVREHLCVLHRCDQPLCINPDHLFLGTHADNMRDMAKKGRGGVRARLSRERAEAAQAMLRAGASLRDVSLAIGTSRSNASRIARRLGLAVGPRAKPKSRRLTKEQARAILVRAASGETAAALAREYGVCDSTIRRIARREIWRHVAAEVAS